MTKGFAPPDTRAILAVFALLGAFACQVVLWVKFGSGDELPAWISTTVGAVIGFYFASRGAEVQQKEQRNGHESGD